MRVATTALGAALAASIMTPAFATKPSLVGDVQIYAVDWSASKPGSQTPIRILDSKGLIGTKLWAAWAKIASPQGGQLCVALKNAMSQPNLIAKGITLEVLSCNFNTITPDMDFLPGPIGSPASVSTTTAHVNFRVPGNSLVAIFTQPTSAGNYADPCFRISIDLVASAQIDFRSFTVTKMLLTGQNAGSPTGCNVPGTLAQALMSAYHDFLGGPNFLAKAQTALDTTHDFSTAALNDAVQTIASQVQSQAQQYLTQAILIEPNKLGIALSPIYAPTTTGAITGKIHWKGTGASNCGPLPIEGRVQTGPQPINPLTLQFSGTPPFATVGKNASAGASTRGADGSYECSYAETNLPARVPVSFAPVNACGGSTTQALAHGVSIKPLGWSGTASPSSAGLDFEADALICGSSVGALAKSAMAFNLALLPHGPDSMINQGDVAYARGDYAGAAKAYGQAFSANPKSYVALHNLALANAKLGNTSQAKSQLSQALSLAQAARDAAAAKAIGNSIGALGG